MVDAEDKRERGTSLMFIGLALWVADLLVIFYLPSAVKLGRHGMFLGIIATLAALGVIAMVAGYQKRRQAGTED
ncbi:MAG: hypothetical protein LAO03_01995 [Acidobacteriia bacterium]|nr:hypothetical protein [Terriglobia bacterium]